ncbi:hypothetical protein DFJ73DRAFT_14480 [Zopfochytrium polystomum]|nr:hypothetical protein DFJ73DRAFT_14480 [Zopfochytrium polystomum]
MCEPTGYIIHTVCLELLRRELTIKGYNLSTLVSVIQRHCSSRSSGVLYSRYIPDRPFIGPPQGVEKLLCQSGWTSEANTSILWMLADPTALELSEPGRPSSVPVDTALEYDSRSSPSAPTGHFASAPEDDVTALLAWRRWVQGSTWFLNKICHHTVSGPNLAPNEWATQKSLVNLPELLVSVAAHLSAADIQALESTCRTIFGARNRLWMVACLRDGFACFNDSPTAAMRDMVSAVESHVSMKAVYYCSASQNYRRIQRVIRWLVDRIAEQNAFLDGVWSYGRRRFSVGPPCVASFDLRYEL